MSKTNKSETSKRKSAGRPLVVLAVLICLPVSLLTGTALGFSDEPLLSGIGIALIGVVVGLTILSTGRNKIDPLGPAAFITYSHVLLFLLRPIYCYFYQDGLNIFTGQPFDDSVVAAETIAAIGYLSIAIGMRVADRKVREKELSFVQPKDQLVLPTLWLVFLAGIILYLVYIKQTGWQTFLSILQTGRTQAASLTFESSSAYFYSGLSIATGALILIFILALYAERHVTAIFALLLLAVCTLPSFAAGSRSVFIPTLAALVVILRTRYPRRFAARRLAIWAPFAFIILFIAPRLWRVSLSQGTTISQSLSEAFLPKNYLDGFLGGLDTAMLDSFSIQVQAQGSGAVHFLFGQTYVSLLVAAVPRSFWPNKPVTVDQFLNAQLFPATYAQGTGFSFGFYSEPYLNFGVFGVILVCAIFGYALARLHSRAISSQDIVIRYSAIMASAYTFTLMRGSISFDLQRLLIALIPVLLAAWAARLLMRSRALIQSQKLEEAQ